MRTVKKYMKQVEQIDKTIRGKRDLLERLTHARDNITVQLKEKVQTSNIQDFGDLSDKVMDLQAEIQEQLIERTKAKIRILKTINKLEDGDYIQILCLVYLDGMTLKSASEKIPCHYSTIKKKHGEALLEIKKILEEEKRLK